MYVPSKWSFSMESIMRWWIMETCSVSEQFLWPTWFCINYSQLAKFQRTWKLPSLQRSLKETGSFRFLEQHKPFCLCTVAAGKLCTGFWRSFSWLRCLEKSWKQKSAVSFGTANKKHQVSLSEPNDANKSESTRACIYLSRIAEENEMATSQGMWSPSGISIMSRTFAQQTERRQSVGWTAFRGLGQRLLSGVTFFCVLYVRCSADQFYCAVSMTRPAKMHAKIHAAISRQTANDWTLSDWRGISLSLVSCASTLPL